LLKVSYLHLRMRRVHAHILYMAWETTAGFSTTHRTSRQKLIYLSHCWY